MSVTPRTLHVVVPAVSRPRRVTRVRARPFGTISVFLAATGILGLTSLAYLWQSGQETAAVLRIPALNQQLQGALNTEQVLRTRIGQLTAPNAIFKVAPGYGFKNPDANTRVHLITVPGPVLTKVIYVPVTAHTAAARVRVSSSDAAVTSWWQDAWITLYRLLG